MNITCLSDFYQQLLLKYSSYLLGTYFMGGFSSPTSLVQGLVTFLTYLFTLVLGNMFLGRNQNHQNRLAYSPLEYQRNRPLLETRLCFLDVDKRLSWILFVFVPSAFCHTF